MRIKAYEDRPAIFAPDIGEVVLARRHHEDRFIRAVVVGCGLNKQQQVRLKVQWLESDPTAKHLNKQGYAREVVAGDIGYLTVVDGEPPLYQQVDKGSPP